MNANTSNSTADQRQSPRLISFFPLKGKIEIKKSTFVEVERVSDLSVNGISVVLSQPLTEQSEIKIAVKLSPPKSLEITLTGKVKRCEKLISDHKNQDLKYSCGIEFQSTEKQKHDLESFVRETIISRRGVIDRRRTGRSLNTFSFKNPGMFSSVRLSSDSKNVEIRQLNINDLDNLVAVEVGAWGSEMSAKREMLKARIDVFEEGMLGAFVNGELCGYICVMIVNYASCEEDFTWAGITDEGFIRATHNPKGDCLYGVSLSALPTASKDIPSKLIKASLKLFLRKSLKGILFGSRIPLYYKYASKMTPEEYIKARSSKGRVIDPELAMYQQVNAVPIRIIPNYFDDPDSLNYGVLCFHENPFYAIQNHKFPFFIKDINVNFT